MKKTFKFGILIILAISIIMITGCPSTVAPPENSTQDGGGSSTQSKIFTVKVNNPINCSIKVNPELPKDGKVKSGQNITLTAYADDLLHTFKKWEITGSDVPGEDIAKSKIMITITNDTIISASFEENTTSEKITLKFEVDGEDANNTFPDDIKNNGIQSLSGKSIAEIKHAIIKLITISDDYELKLYTADNIPYTDTDTETISESTTITAKFVKKADMLDDVQFILIDDYTPQADDTDVVTIKDPNLANYIRECLELTTGANITKKDMRQFKIISFAICVPHNTEEDKVVAKDLGGMEHATNLEVFSFARSNITDLTPLANLTKLRKLVCRGNQIVSSAPLANLVNLEFLCLAGMNTFNDTTNLDKLVNLKTLYLDSTNIDSISFADKLTKLELLAIDNTKVSNIDAIKDLTNLKILRIGGKSRNFITDHSRITSLEPLSKLTNLEELLFTQHNVLDVSPLAKLTNLKKLEFTSNYIPAVYPNSATYPEDFSPLLGLEYIANEDLKLGDTNSSLTIDNSLKKFKIAKDFKTRWDAANETEKETLKTEYASFDQAVKIFLNKIVYPSGEPIKLTFTVTGNANGNEFPESIKNNGLEISESNTLANIRTKIGATTASGYELNFYEAGTKVPYLENETFSQSTAIDAKFELATESFKGEGFTLVKGISFEPTYTNEVANFQWLEDVNFKNFVKKCFGLSSQKITEKMMVLFKTINIEGSSSSKFQDLGGLGRAKNLEELILKNHNVKTILQFKSLPKLKKIDLTGNKLTTTKDIHYLSQLESLNLSNIKTFKKFENLEGLSSLKELYMNGTNVGSISFISRLEALTTFEVASESLQDLHLLLSLDNLDATKLKIVNATNDLTAANSKESFNTAKNFKTRWGATDSSGKETLRTEYASFGKNIKAFLKPWDNEMNPKFAVTVTPATNGSISVNPTLPTDNQVANNTELTLTATPNAGYQFKQWTITGSSITQGTATDPEIKITVTTATTVQAEFEESSKFAVTVTPAINGSISVNPTLPTDNQVANNTELTLTATPESGYKFKQWTITGSTITQGTAADPEIKITVTIATTIQAEFEAAGTIQEVAFAEFDNFLKTISESEVTVKVINITNDNLESANNTGTLGNIIKTNSGKTINLIMQVANDVSELDGWEFYQCSNLKSLTVSGNIKTIRDQQIFDGCTNLATIILKEGLTTIESNIFKSLTNTSIKLPSTITSIGSKAFGENIWPTDNRVKEILVPASAPNVKQLVIDSNYPDEDGRIKEY